ncbi:MAG: rRNA maturation RNase YbeY [Lentimicrobiaceae bacterium]|jgi:rRNA maturation RNase YbeY|nr:rRNA maturation RNase YbeY [Lentimicrobiaceae bacterium]
MIQIQGHNVSVIEFNLEALKAWIDSIITFYKKKTGQVFFLFCSDDYLLEINKTYLEHDYYTDVITFPTTESDTIISGEIYISLDRIKDNAIQFQRSFHDELHCVMAHGVLHLIGFKDKTPAEELQMRNEEEKCLFLRPSVLKI